MDIPAPSLVSPILPEQDVAKDDEAGGGYDARTMPAPDVSQGLSPGRAPVAPAPWDLADLAGRLVEITAGARVASSEPRPRTTNIWDIDESRRYGSAALTAATSLVWKAQQLGEPVAWINARASSFFPPDLDAAGIDLAALVVVRVNDGRAAARASDKLLRSGAFGLVVLDLGVNAVVPAPLLSRLLGLARKHHAAVVFVTEGCADASLAPIVSLRVTASRRTAGRGHFTCTVEARKDKRRAPGWIHEETFRGPPGLR